MEFLDWIKLGLAVLLAVIGLIVLGAWALLRRIDAQDEDYWR
jgi:flagellar biogenesis protein FliO